MFKNIGKSVEMYYQPIVCTNTKDIYKYEALARLEHKGKVLLPGKFIEFAIRKKVYEKLSEAIMTKVFLDIKHTQNNISFNIGMGDINNLNFYTYIFKKVAQCSKRENLTIEITEIGKFDFKKVKIFIDHMREMGVKIAIDDFGTGYSNFENLIRLNFDYIKMDGFFIREIDNKNCQHLIASIINYSRNNGIKTIAEHVETKEIFDKVCNLGFDYSQGFYHGKAEKMVQG